MLGRDTAWRQGHLLTAEHAFSLGLSTSIDSETRVVVATHDCDLANDHETEVEVLVGRKVNSQDGMLAKARNPRRLHLTYSIDGSPTHLEVAHGDRRSLRREDFLGRGVLEGIELDLDEKRSLKQWLAARYGRPAFPNAFETRLRKKQGKQGVEQLIGKIAKPLSSHLVGIFFDLGEQRAEEVQADEPYYLSIFVVYDAIEGGPRAREAAEHTASGIGDLFTEAYGSPSEATEIALEKCVALADTDMSLAALRRMDQWRLEYVSLSESPPSDFVAQGMASF